MAVNIQSGQELWRQPITQRVGYMLNDSASTMLVSPDGRRLYLYSLVFQTGDSAGTKLSRLQVIDAETGTPLPDASPRLKACGASPQGDELYITCRNSNDVYFINTQTWHIDQHVTIARAKYDGLPGRIAGSVLTPTGQYLYVLRDDFQLVVIDTAQQAIARVVNLLNRKGHAVVGERWPFLRMARRWWWAHEALMRTKEQRTTSSTMIPKHGVWLGNRGWIAPFTRIAWGSFLTDGCTVSRMKGLTERTAWLVLERSKPEGKETNR